MTVRVSAMCGKRNGSEAISGTGIVAIGIMAVELLVENFGFTCRVVSVPSEVLTEANRTGLLILRVFVELSG